MAFTPLIPGNINLVVTQGLGQQTNSLKITGMDGTTAIDFSAWDQASLTAKITASNPNPNTADLTFGTVAGLAGGIITITTGASDLASVPPGTALLRVYGKPTSGDSNQLIATGTCTVQAA